MKAGVPWWAGAVGYEVYLPSFQDSNGDGWGDLPGLTSRLDYLQDLGADLIWVSPFYPSPMKDHGYDVADYLSVDPRFGTLEDVDRLLDQAHRRGIRVIADLVVNHTSDRHAWFADARRSRDSRWRDYYIWRDPRPGGGPPNNWLSHFGGAAWTYDHGSGQYYLHLFTPHQPDLNWENPAVADEVDMIIDFWLEHGLDGFRVDTAHYLAKHPGLPDNPMLAGDKVPRLGGVSADWLRQDHRHDIGQEMTLDIHRRWRVLADKRGALLVGEVYVLDPARLATYVDGCGLHSAFFFGLVESAWQPRRTGRMLADATAASPSLSWVQSSHDRPRAVTRYGGGPQGWRRWLAHSVLLAALPGPMFLYQGEELGLGDGLVPAGCDPDPLARAGGLSRAGCRTPMPWEPVTALGFTSTARAWLPFGDRAGHETAAVQAADPGSPLSAVRRLIAARRAVGIAPDEPVDWLERGLLVAYRRGDVLAAANLGDAPAALDPGSGNWRVVFDTHQAAAGTSRKGRLSLRPEQAVLAVCRPSAPEGHGGEPGDAFHVVCPSLPGYGFSGKPTEPGWGIERIASAWIILMERLGQQAPEKVVGLHLTPPLAPPDPATFGDLTDRERSALESLRRSAEADSGYSAEHATRPQTIGYALTDSPAALAAWIIEKFWSWTDHDGDLESVISRDELLDNLMLYWLPRTGASSARLYWESIRRVNEWISGTVTDTVSVPVGCSVFPKELQRPSRRWAQRRFTDIRYWNEPERGGHFAAFEQPALFVKEVRKCFRALR